MKLLEVGREVRILAAGDRIGQVAKIIEVDKYDDYVPYKVRFDDGFECWLESQMGGEVQYEVIRKSKGA